MCECICGEANPIFAIRVGESIVAIDLYRGCKSCDLKPGIWLDVYPASDEDLLDGLKVEMHSDKSAISHLRVDLQGWELRKP